MLMAARNPPVSLVKAAEISAELLLGVTVHFWIVQPEVSRSLAKSATWLPDVSPGLGVLKLGVSSEPLAGVPVPFCA
jgi:hypothetical protein